MAGEKEGKGGREHRYIQGSLADYFMKKNKTVFKEGFIGKNVDLLVIDDEKTIAIEIELSSRRHSITQIKRDYESGIDSVWVVCKSPIVLKNIKSKVQQILNEELFLKTQFFLVKDFGSAYKEQKNAHNAE